MEIMPQEDRNRIVEIYSEVKRVKDAIYQAHPNGPRPDRYSIFHAPVSFCDIPCLIVGHRPGPTPLLHLGNYSEETEPPTQNLLATRNNPYSFNAQNLFARANRLEALSLSQSTDVHFFREKDMLSTVDKVCFEYFKEIVSLVRPRSIIAVGNNAAQVLTDRRAQRLLGSTFHFDGIPDRDPIPVAVVWHFSRISLFDENAINTTIQLIRSIVPKR